MDEIALRRLETMARAASGGRAGKFRAIPLRMASSLLLQRLTHWLRRPLGRRVPLFWGDDMTVIFPDGLSMMLYRYGFFEEGLTRTLVELLRPGSVFFDVGTHFGYFTLLGAHLVGPQGQVHAFEPTPRTFGVLSANLADRPNVHLSNVAVYSRETTLEFHDFGIEWPAFNSIYRGRLDTRHQSKLRRADIQVRAVTLDGYIQKTNVRPDFIKIDTEGAELDVLRGMERTLRDIKPALSIEVDSAGDDQDAINNQILDLLLAAGYEPYEYARTGLVKHERRAQYTYDNLFFLHPERPRK